ncbi:MAG TPA: DUF4382 domain-containing protein [Gemmatimonadales bacterium]|nr:DUF4382 domain-containing protein [Gemmatimonadales bacterium]
MRGWRLALGVAALAGCDAAETGPGPVAEGKTAVFLTDAPFPFDGIARVDIHVEQIALSPTADTAEGAPDWVVLATPRRTFNLLDLQNGATALLGEAIVPPGHYRAVRLVFDPSRSSMTETDGDAILTASGPGAPGIDWQSKGQAPSLFALVEEAMAIGKNGEDIVLDFDVGRSFHYDGQAGFTFLPYLRAITRAGSGAVTGRLLRAGDGGPIARAVVSAHIAPDSAAQLGPLLATSRSADDGRFTASFLRPGRYQLVADDLARDVSSEPVAVEVRAGETADAGEIRF